MNRTYKVIWSKARRCYVVVSELAKGQHKSSSKSEHISSNVHRGGYLGKAAAAAVVASLLTFGGMAYSPVMATDNTTVTDSNGNAVTNTDKNTVTDSNGNTVKNTDNKIKDINANITGKGNKVFDSSDAEIVGDGNTVTNEAKGDDNSVRYVRSNDARIHGSGNTISASRNQQVIGDNNQIIGRDDGTVTDYQHPEGREPNVSDLTIGRGNFIRSTDTYRNEWDSLKVIGNNNRADFKIESAGGPAAGIVIGDNQNIDGIKDSIVIGSLSPDEQKEQVGEDGYKSDKYTVGLNSVVVGYHATSSKDASTVIGNRSKVSGNYQTVTGLRSTIEGNYYNSFNLLDGQSGNFASIYGSFNKIEDATGEDDMDGVGNSINGSMNVTSNARGTMIMGVGNTVTHSKGEFLFPKDDDSGISTGDLLYVGLSTASDYAQGRDITGDNLTYPADQVYAYMRDAWQRYMETSGGAVSVLGNSNTSDYVIRSQILGTNNMLKGSEDNISSYNTISGFSNTGTNVKRTAIVGTGNNLTNGVDNVVIGDYHTLENGKHNVILGSMASEEKAVKKTAKAAWAATDDNPDGTYTYTVNEQVALKPNTKDIENAVMVGYNTDVTQSGGVALGADSVASTKEGIPGFDPQNRKHDSSDKDYSTWVSTDAAVSVGGADREVKYKDKEGKEQVQIVKSTRQITNVAAGKEDTDAVNVAQLKAISNTVDASKTKYYSVRDIPFTSAQYAAYTNEKNDGAKEMGALAAGYMTYAGGIASTVTGSLSGVINRAAAPGSQDFRGATALSYGTFNINDNTAHSGAFSGVANSIVGQANMTTDSNAALIYGAGNVISNSYRDIDISKMGAITSNLKDPIALGEALQKAVPTSGGQVMAFGGGNVVDNAYMTQVIGVGNTVKGNQKKNNDGTWSSDGTAQLNYVDGFYTKLINGKNDYLIGAHNTVTGDSVEKNHSNIVIGDNHTLENRSNNIILGSADSALPTTASQVTILGHNANATVNGGVALGYGSVADREAGKAGLDMSIVTNGKVGDFSKDTSPVWTSNAAAVSVGHIAVDKEGKLDLANTITRQITGVAAGREDYDAVNVAQLRAVASKVGSVMNLVAGDGISIVNKDGVYTISANIKSGSTPTDDVKVDPEKPGEGGNTSGSTTDTPVTPVDPGNTGNTDNPGNMGNTENPGNTDNPSNGSGLIITAETKPTHFGDDSGDATAVKPGETLAIKGDTTNITTTASDHGITVSLKKDIAVDSVTAGDTKMTSDGLTITGGPSITKSGIDAGGKKVTHVADGEIAADSKDAVNGSQLYRVQKNVESIEDNVTNLAGDVTNLNGRVSDLDNRVNKVGAGAAALAALHPLDFDPDDKWDFAVGYGNYRNANSVAFGAFYRPNEDTMFSLGTNFGNGENMFNAGLSFKIGQGGSGITTSKTAMAKTISSLKDTVHKQDQKIEGLENVVDTQDKKIAELEALVKEQGEMIRQYVGKK